MPMYAPWAYEANVGSQGIHSYMTFLDIQKKVIYDFF